MRLEELRTDRTVAPTLTAGQQAAADSIARMIESGEDPKFIARRMVIFASEDIGLAQPTQPPSLVREAPRSRRKLVFLGVTVLAVRFGRFGGKWTEVTLPAGAGAVYVPLQGEGNEVTVRLAGTAPAVLGSAPQRLAGVQWIRNSPGVDWDSLPPCFRIEVEREGRIESAVDGSPDVSLNRQKPNRAGQEGAGGLPLS